MPPGAGKEVSRRLACMNRVSQETGSAAHINHVPGERRSLHSWIAFCAA